MSFSQYQIKSSHNSYLPKAQVCWCKTNWKSYINKLLSNNVKCIELDCFFDNSRIVVAHAIEETKCNIFCSQKIPFTDMLTEIYDKFSTGTNKMPLIINLELHLNSIAEEILAGIITTVAGDVLVPRIINPKIDKPEDFLGKIIFMASGNIKSLNLKSLVTLPIDNNNVMNESCKDFNFEKFKELIKDKETMVRIYPDNIIISKNYDVEKFLQIGCQFVSINFQFDDDYLKYYQKYFENTNGFKLKI
jgi:hypothetical protein